ncbi:hypothetical protein DESUT3_02110 [Desulfuromonas versatilis]|uniref:Uncharacterized protein n=1 Tax=Desulfuromonas versatilis TaxID=2802975 RepID=A0ABM9SDD3_9BACT|nr:hypothetical protein [Desulfuromonas versatilis]BCR03142.1 hypothetical protein DESUT3_02110 [Desulfuromonas versatilis]
MKSTTLSVGAPIEARCTKCRKNTGHIIVTMAEKDPVKVQCNKCNRQHKYRPPITAKKPAGRQTADPKVAERKEWAVLRPGMNSAEATNYSMTAAYKVQALVNHPVFGLGLVQRVAGPQKVEILFEDGKKTMRCK